MGDVARWRESRKEMVLSADKLRKKEKERIKTGKIRKVCAAFSREWLCYNI